MIGVRSNRGRDSLHAPPRYTRDRSARAYAIFAESRYTPHTSNCTSRVCVWETPISMELRTKREMNEREKGRRRKLSGVGRASSLATLAFGAGMTTMGLLSAR
jgi:hypothetical protein